MRKTKEEQTREIAERLIHKASELHWDGMSETDIERLYDRAKAIADYLDDQARNQPDPYESTYY